MLLLLLACTSPLPESERPFTGAGALGALRLEGQALLDPAGAVVLEGVVEAPVHQGDRVCAAGEGADAQGELACFGGPGPGLRLHGGRPDRLVLSPDGAFLAWFASPQGVPALHLAPTDGSAPPRRLTPAAPRPGGGRPEGFVPPPHRGAARFDGDLLRWESPEGPVELRWR